MYYNNAYGDYTTFLIISLAAAMAYRTIYLAISNALKGAIIASLLDAHYYGYITKDNPNEVRVSKGGRVSHQVHLYLNLPSRTIQPLKGYRSPTQFEALNA